MKFLGTKKGKVQALLLLLEDKDGRPIHEASSSELSYPFVIGRRGTNGWVIPAEDKSASGTHAEVYSRRGALWIRDLGSLNGIYVMGQRVKEAKLEPNMKVGIGSCRFVVSADHRANDARAHQFHRLMRTNGPKTGDFIDLKEGTTPVGCGITDGVSCDSFLVSRHHADLICMSDDSCWVEDRGMENNGSTNGTRVNGTLLKKGTKRLLRDGDLVSFADCEFKFCDRNKQAPYPWLKMLFIAVVTVSMYCGGYFFFQVLFPSAERLLNDERQLEWNEEFEAALQLLDKVPDARGGDAFVDEVARRKANICVWTNTIARWRDVRGAFTSRGWVTASKELGSLLSGSVDGWGWNTTTAQAEKHKAKVMKYLLDVFLDSRKVLRDTFHPSEQGHEKEVMLRCLQRMDAALKSKDWNDSLPTGYMRKDMENQRDMMKAIVMDLMTIDSTLSRISQPAADSIEYVVESTADFESIIAKLEDLAKKSEERNQDESEKARKENPPRNFHPSHIVLGKCQTYLPSLRKIVETRNALVANCEALAALEYDKMKKDLPLPSESQTSVLPVLAYIRDGMRRANEQLNGQIRMDIEDQVSRLAKLGISTNGIPDCIAALQDESKTKKAFLCDTLDPSTRPPSATRGNRVGEYDRLFGMEELGSFIQNIEDEVVPRPFSDTGRPLPLLIQAIQVYGQMARFGKCCESPEVQYLLKLESPKGNKLRNMLETVTVLQEKKSLLISSWLNRHDEDMRANIVAHAAALALDAGENRTEKSVEKFVSEKQAWKAALERLDRRIKEDPVCVEEVRPKILGLAIPGVSYGRSTRHWEDAAARGGR